MDLFDLYKKVYGKWNKMCEIGMEFEFLPLLIDDITDIIFNQFGIPKDNSSNTDIKDKKFFCRDYWYDLLDRFGNGKLSKPKLIEKLKNCKK